jgi:hypothetical protein
MRCETSYVSRPCNVTLQPALPQGTRNTRHAMDKVASNFGSQFGSLTIISTVAACVWPAKTVGAGGLEPPAPRL